MKRSLLLALGLWLLAPCSMPGAANILVKGPVGAGPANNGFTAVKTITIDNTKVGSSTHTDFPVLVQGTYSYLATTGNGGSVTSSSGYDVVFYPNSDCSGTKYAHEIDLYTAATGAVAFHVKVPSVSHTAGTVFYMCYGKSAITTSQEDKTGTWGSFIAVYHFGTSSSLVLSDSTSSGYTLTNSAATAAAGQISGGAAFAADASLSNTSIAGPANITVEWWQNVPSSGLPANPYSFTFGSAFSTSNRIAAHAPYGDSTIYWDYGTDTTGSGRVTTSYTGNFNAWKHIALTYNNSTGLHAIYINGALANSNTSSNSPSVTQLWIGTDIGNTGCCRQRATIDEFRVSNVARSADWLLATFNNHNSPSTFYAVTP